MDNGKKVTVTYSHERRAFQAGDKWFPLKEDGVFEQADVDYPTSFKAMAKLLAAGKVQAIGVSTSTSDALRSCWAKIPWYRLQIKSKPIRTSSSPSCSNSAKATGCESVFGFIFGLTQADI